MATSHYCCVPLLGLADLLRLVVAPSRSSCCPRHATAAATADLLSPSCQGSATAAGQPPLLRRSSTIALPLLRHCPATAPPHLLHFSSTTLHFSGTSPPLLRHFFATSPPLLRHSSSTSPPLLLQFPSRPVPPPHSRARRKCASLSPASPLAAALAAALPTLTSPLAPPLVPAHAPSLVRRSLSVSTLSSGCRHGEVGSSGSCYPSWQV